jgi:hypothetical protein
VDRLTKVAHTQARMISEITSTCMAAEADNATLRAALEEVALRTTQRDLNRAARKALGEAADQ